LYQLVSQSAGANSGCVFIRSDRPVFATELFAKDDVTALANVPPQQVVASFDPHSDLPRITPVPQLAVIETGKTLTFKSGTTATVQWSVNGTAGGNAAIGTITDAGLYTAPSKAPAPKTLTIQASIVGQNNSGASSMDVVQREQLTGGLTLVTAVAYLESQSRFFVAEQKLLSSAPTIGFAAPSANTQISEVISSGGSTTNSAFVQVPGDTISKMLPYDSGSNHYLLLAGQDLGKIYRLDVGSKALATVTSGLNQPSSMALDPTTGNLLVAEAGAGQITVISASQIASASEPSMRMSAPGDGGRLQILSVPKIQGIAVDKCNGTVYVTLTDNTIWQYQGNSKSQVDSSDTFLQPAQLLALYRDGFSCATALTLAVVETGRISLVYPKGAIPRTTLIDNLTGVKDVTYFPKGNPFTAGNEASIGVAEASSTPSQGKVEDVHVGGCYQSTPPVIFTTTGLFAGTGPNQDPIGDVFDQDAISGLGLTTVPDIVSVTGSSQGGQSVITIKFASSVTLGGVPTGPTFTDGLWVFIYMKTTAGSSVLSQFPIPIQLVLSDYFPFGNPGIFIFDSFLGVFYAEGVYASVTGQSSAVKVSAIGNTLTLSVPTSALDLKGTTAIVLVGNQAVFTDVAPNNGVLNLSP
jgi:hypothetical protein